MPGVVLAEATVQCDGYRLLEYSMVCTALLRSSRRFVSVGSCTVTMKL